MCVAECGGAGSGQQTERNLYPDRTEPIETGPQWDLHGSKAKKIDCRQRPELSGIKPKIVRELRCHHGVDVAQQVGKEIGQHKGQKNPPQQRARIEATGRWHGTAHPVCYLLAGHFGSASATCRCRSPAAMPRLSSSAADRLARSSYCTAAE